MNGYDFDNTILQGNSMRRFYMYCLIRLPYLILLFPLQIFVAFLRLVRVLSYSKFYHILQWFVVFVPRIERFVERFWDKNLKHIRQWYLDQRRDDDLIISASPQFLVEEACRRLGVRCLATELNPHNAKIEGKQCYGPNKVEVYRDNFGETPLATFYSDSLSDVPMLAFAERGYFVRGNNLSLMYENGVMV